MSAAPNGVGSLYDDGIAWRSRDRGSCLYHADRAEVMAQLPEGSIDCIWTDPPYLLSNDGTTCVAGRRVSVNRPIRGFVIFSGAGFSPNIRAYLLSTGCAVDFKDARKWLELYFFGL